MQTCLWECFWFYTHNTVALKSLSGKISPKINLTLSPELDIRAGEPGDKASWLVEDWGWGWAIKGIRGTQPTLPAGPTFSIVCRFCITTKRKSTSWDIWEHSVVLVHVVEHYCCQFLLQVSGCTGLKTRVMNNLLATFCLHFTRARLKCVAPSPVHKHVTEKTIQSGYLGCRQARRKWPHIKAL